MTLLTGFCSQGRVVPIAREQQKNLLKQGTNKAEAKIGARSEKKCGKILHLPCYQLTKGNTIRGQAAEQSMKPVS